MVHEYGGWHFEPHSKLGKVYRLSDVILETDREMGMFDYSRPEKGYISKYPYTHESFYRAMKNSQMDIFRCVENGKLYVPCEHELFIYHGMRGDNKESKGKE